MLEVSAAVLGLLGQDVGLLKRVAQGYSTDDVMGHWLKENDLVLGIQKEELTVGNQVETILHWEGRLCVPNTAGLCEAFIRQCHDPVGHFGVEKTLEMTRHSYFWPGMKDDVSEFVKSCPTCQISKTLMVKPVGRLHSLPVPQAKFLDIGSDFIGPLPVLRGYDQLIVITDRLTGYVVLIPTNMTMNSTKLAHLLYDHWLSKPRCPRSIVSDQGSVFQSTLWKHLTCHIGAKSQLSTTYHPQTDGISERSNKLIIESLHTIMDIHGCMWADNIQCVTFALNNHVRASTNCTPTELMFGHRLTHVPPLVAETPEKITEALKFLVPTEEEWQAAAWWMELEEGKASWEFNQIHPPI